MVSLSLLCVFQVHNSTDNCILHTTIKAEILYNTTDWTQWD